MIRYSPIRLVYITLQNSWENLVVNQKKTLTILITFNPLHPNISIQILITLLFTFPLIITRRIRLTQSFSGW